MSTPIDPTLPPTVIFGCGYVGGRLARALLADGQPVRAYARRVDRLAPLAELGAEVHALDASRPKVFGPALRGVVSPTVVYAIPPIAGLPGGEAVRRAAVAALGAGARSFVYLGSSGLYGTRPDEEWVDEETSVSLGDPDMAPRIQDETAVEGAAASGLRTVVLRLAAIYGPGRGVRQRLRKGDYKLIDDGEHWFSRIHVDDLVAIIRAAADRAPPGAKYLVGDDHPARQRDYAEWLCRRLGLPMPPSISMLSSGAPRTLLRGRRIRNEKMKRELGVTLRYPSYVEGEAQIEAEEAAARDGAEAGGATAGGASTGGGGEAGGATAGGVSTGGGGEAGSATGEAGSPGAARGDVARDDAAPSGGMAAAAAAAEAAAAGAAATLGAALVTGGAGAAGAPLAEGAPATAGRPGASPLPSVSSGAVAPAPPAGAARPAIIRHVSELPSRVAQYPDSDELLSERTALAAPLGLRRIAANHVVLPPGRRSSWPHAHSDEEELLYVLEGEPDVWLDGVTHRLRPGDVVAFPPGTGVAHTVLNDTDQPVRMLVVGEQRCLGDRLVYPLHPERTQRLRLEERWSGAPRAPLGPHDAVPRRRG